MRRVPLGANASDQTSQTVNEREIVMTPTRTPAEQLAACIDANVPVFLMGAPGTAKTATLEAMAAERGWHLEIVIASAQDPTTILGIPMPSEDRKYTEPTIPGWARRINAAADAGQVTMLFLDELSTVAPIVAGPLLGVVQSRRADGWTLPADCRIVAAANPPDLAVGGWAIEPAMANRWAHIAWPEPTAEWIVWATARGGALATVAEYIDAVPTDLLQVPARVTDRSGPWPSPRSWTRGAELVDATGDWSMLALTVGQVAADTFAGWLERRDIPSVAELIDGSRGLPERPDAFRTSILALATASTDGTFERTIEILATAAGTDPATVAEAVVITARRAGKRGIRGLADLVANLEAVGVDFSTVTVSVPS